MIMTKYFYCITGLLFICLNLNSQSIDDYPRITIQNNKICKISIYTVKSKLDKTSTNSLSTKIVYDTILSKEYFYDTLGLLKQVKNFYPGGSLESISEYYYDNLFRVTKIVKNYFHKKDSIIYSYNKNFIEKTYSDNYKEKIYFKNGREIKSIKYYKEEIILVRSFVYKKNKVIETTAIYSYTDKLVSKLIYHYKNNMLINEDGKNLKVHYVYEKDFNYDNIVRKTKISQFIDRNKENVSIIEVTYYSSLSLITKTITYNDNDLPYEKYISYEYCH